ncbi:hypothetical protein [Methanomethylovorans sp.]|uniref:DUF7289 family protein n=1 Tax=Methanomethylovorans sp. TaxID=2758717 RepID=UPI00351C5A29
MTQENRKDSAVSETVGYILMFSIVILSMSFIYTMGYPVLQKNIGSSVFENAEQSFIVLQSHMKRVAFDQAPVKVMKIKLHSSTISISNGSSIVISYDNNSLSYDTGKIEFSKDEKLLAYENGGVWKQNSPLEVLMVSQPPIYTGRVNNINTTTIGIISIKGHRSMAGSGIASIIMKHKNSSLITSDTPVNVTVQINSIYSSQWAKYLEENGFDIINSNLSAVSARRDNTMLFIGDHVIDVSIT